VARIEVGVDASPGALRALAWAPVAGGRPPEEGVVEALEQRTMFQEAVRRQAEDLPEAGS
jgi:hypothetical protein